MDKYKSIILRGYAIAEVQFVSKNEQGKILYKSNKIACVKVECEAIKHELIEYEDIYTIDNSSFDYDEKDIKISEPSDFVIYDVFDIKYLDELEQSQNVGWYVGIKKAEDDRLYPIEANEIVKLIRCDMNEVCD